MQKEMTLLGSVTRPLTLHDERELKCCRTKGQACRVSVIFSGFSQDLIADRMGITPGYLSLLLSGKKRWTDDMQRRFSKVTGSLAALQWDAMQEGLDLYLDPVKQKLAALDAERAELLARCA